MTLGEEFGKAINWFTENLVGGSEPEFIDEMEPGDFTGYPTEGVTALKPYEDTYSTRTSKREESTNVRKLPGYKGYEVRIVEPRSFADTTQIVQQLIKKKTVILNLHLLDKETAQKTIDFVCGATFAIGGKPQKIGDTVFVFTPNSVQLSVETKETNSFGVDGLLGSNF